MISRLSGLKSTNSQNGDRGFQCPMCPKKFGKRGDFTRHQRIHTGEKPYSCEICGKAFNRKGNMMSHKLTHFNVGI